MEEELAQVQEHFKSLCLQVTERLADLYIGTGEMPEKLDDVGDHVMAVTRAAVCHEGRYQDMWRLYRYGLMNDRAVADLLALDAYIAIPRVAADSVEERRVEVKFPAN